MAKAEAEAEAEAEASAAVVAVVGSGGGPRVSPTCSIVPSTSLVSVVAMVCRTTGCSDLGVG